MNYYIADPDHMPHYATDVGLFFFLQMCMLWEHLINFITYSLKLNSEGLCLIMCRKIQVKSFSFECVYM